MITALTRAVPPCLSDCELTFRRRRPIDIELARKQHAEYCRVLSASGASVFEIPRNSGNPDSCFVEDTAVITNEIAVICNMGVASRRFETADIASALAKHRPLAFIEAPGTIEGGDVLKAGKLIFVGLSQRTNREGFDQVKRVLEPFGYQVRPVGVKSSLHLGTACSFLNCETVLLNSEWVDESAFSGFRILRTPAAEAWAANTLRVNGTLCADSAFPRTIELIQKYHPRVQALDISEFHKAEAGLSCLSLIFFEEDQGEFNHSKGE